MADRTYCLHPTQQRHREHRGHRGNQKTNTRLGNHVVPARLVRVLVFSVFSVSSVLGLGFSRRLHRASAAFSTPLSQPPPSALNKSAVAESCPRWACT